MALDFSQEGTVRVKMIDYIKKMLAELPKDMNGIATTPAADHLFQINSHPVLLSDECTDLFHHHVAQ